MANKTTGQTATPSELGQSDNRQDLLTCKEAAAWLRVGVPTIRSWIVHGVLKDVLNVGSEQAPRYLIPRQSVLDKFQPVRTIHLV